MQQIKKFSKYLFRFLLLLIVALLLIALIVQIPAVQQSLTGKLENYLEAKLQTKIDMGSIRLKLPKSLVLKQLYVEDLQQDTFLNIGELSLNFKLNQLFKKRIQFDQIILTNAKGRLYMATDTTNYDFILDAFGAKSNPFDSLPEVPDSSSGWMMTFDQAALQLEDIDFQLTDDGQGLFLKTYIGELDGVFELADYIEQNYRVDRLHLKDTWGKFEMEPKLDNLPSQTNLKMESNIDLPDEVEQYYVGANAILLENVAVDMATPSMELSMYIQRLENKESFFSLAGEETKIELPFLEIVNSKIRYDLPELEQPIGFDYKQLNLQNINATVADFSMENLDFTGELVQLSAKDDQGFELKNLECIIGFSDDEIILEDLLLKTSDTVEVAF